jgi:glycosyltransferase involved in cell wall biosynthesis
MSLAESPRPTATPAVTVLIPVFNAGWMLVEAVNSILDQTYSDFECLVINDGSTDGGFEALRSLTDPRLRLVDNPRNLGLISTLNRGIELARAPLLARMDADDISMPARLELQVAEFDRRPGLVLLGCRGVCITERGEVFSKIDAPVGSKEVVSGLLRRNAFIHPSVMFRTDVIRRLGGYSQEAMHAEDYDLWLRVAEQHEVDNLPAELLRYRVHGRQVSQTKLRSQQLMTVRIQQEAWGRYRRLGKAVLPPFPQSAWRQWTAREGTLGANYWHWAYVNFRVGAPAAGRSTALQGLLVAPLAWRLYRLLLPDPRSPRALVREVLRRILSLIRSRK